MSPNVLLLSNLSEVIWVDARLRFTNNVIENLGLLFTKGSAIREPGEAVRGVILTFEPKATVALSQPSDP